MKSFDVQKKENQAKSVPVGMAYSKMERFLKVLIGILTGLITLIILVFINFPIADIREDVVSKSYTATPLPPTFTPKPTHTPTATQVPTIAPTPTVTLLPPSAYIVKDVTLVTPGVPQILSSNVIILNDDKNVTVEPGYDNIQWTDSTKIAQDYGLEIPEPYHLTLSPGKIKWSMDVPLDPGMYEIYVLDTLYSSGGSLKFKVELGDKELMPILGKAQVDYKSSMSLPPQREDIWQSIGVYRIDPIGLLSVSTNWELRNESTIVAVDRILILKLPESSSALLNLLPEDRQKFLVDDPAAIFETDQYWEIRDDPQSWGNQYHVIANPPISTTVGWEIPHIVPAGKYEVLVWAPKLKGTAEISYKMFIRDAASPFSEFADDKGETEIKLTQGDKQEGHWISLGTWTTLPVYGEWVYLKLQLSTARDTIGEVGVDAAVFIKMP